MRNADRMAIDFDNAIAAGDIKAAAEAAAELKAINHAVPEVCENCDKSEHQCACASDDDLVSFADYAEDRGVEIPDPACAHKPDWSLATKAQGCRQTFDVPCKICGCSGSFLVRDSDVNW